MNRAKAQVPLSTHAPTMTSSRLSDHSDEMEIVVDDGYESSDGNEDSSSIGPIRLATLDGRSRVYGAPSGLPRNRLTSKQVSSASDQPPPALPHGDLPATTPPAEIDTADGINNEMPHAPDVDVPMDRDSNVLPASASSTTKPSSNSSEPKSTSVLPPRDDVWAFQAQQRAQSTKAKKSKDVTNYRPTMDELSPLLQKHAAGILTFEDTLPIQKHSPRDVVGWLQMPTGSYTKGIDLAAAMTSLLFDNQALGMESVLVDVIKCEKDLQNRMLKWGVASDEAIKQLCGVSFKIQVARDGTSQKFTMSVPHVLDGFFIDIPTGLHNQDEERLMFNMISKLEPRFLWGAYTATSSTTGLAGSRYRLYFEGATVPASMHRDGRIVEEFIFKGRSLRVYGQGWFFRDRNLVRIDLDSIAFHHGLHSAPPRPTNAPNTAPKTTKRQKTTQPSQPWTPVPTKAKRKKASGPAGSPPESGRSWISPNLFAALDERVSVEPVEHSTTVGTTNVSFIVPRLVLDSGSKKYATSGEFINGITASQGSLQRVETSLDEILAELDEIDAKAAAIPTHLPAQVDDAINQTSFNLSSLIKEGKVDKLCSYLERSPIEFGIQLQQIFTEDRASFEYFVRLRLLHRWLRATWDGTKPFTTLYEQTFGALPTQSNVISTFSDPKLSSRLPYLEATLDGDEVILHRVEVEEMLAIAEVLFAVHAPLYYNNDAVILASTKCAVSALPTRLGKRALSSETLTNLLLDTQVGLSVWKIMESMYTADDESMRHTMSTVLVMYESGYLDITLHNQVMFNQTEPTLTQGDLADLIAVPNRG